MTPWTELAENNIEVLRWLYVSDSWVWNPERYYPLKDSVCVVVRDGKIYPRDNSEVLGEYTANHLLRLLAGWDADLPTLTRYPIPHPRLLGGIEDHHRAIRAFYGHSWEIDENLADLTVSDQVCFHLSWETTERKRLGERWPVPRIVRHLQHLRDAPVNEP